MSLKEVLSHDIYQKEVLRRLLLCGNIKVLEQRCSMSNGGIPIGMEMESPGCIAAYKAACREAELKRIGRKKREAKKVKS